MPTVFIQQCLTKNLLNPSIVLALLVHGTYFNLLYCNRLYYFDGVQLYQTYNALGNFIRTIERTLGPRGRNRATLFAKTKGIAAWQTFISCLSYLCTQFYTTYQIAMTPSLYKIGIPKFLMTKGPQRRPKRNPPRHFRNVRTLMCALLIGAACWTV